MAASPFFTKAMMTNQRRKVLVVGVGSIGQRHARLCRERVDLSVELCDSRAESLEAARRNLGDVACWTDLHEALDQAPHVVIVATPHDQHERVVTRALAAGAHVLCEKPMAHELASARRMLDAAAAHSRVLRIAFMMRFHPGVRRIRELLHNGTLGAAICARYSVGSYITLENSVSRHQETTFGAAVMDYSHGIDLVGWLLQRQPLGAYARGIQAGNVEFTSSPNLLSAILDYEDGLLSELHIDYLTKPQANTLEVIGDAASASLDFESRIVTVRHRQSNELIHEAFAGPRDDIYRAQLTSFLRGIDGQTDELTTPSEGLQSVACSDAIISSLKTGARVEIPHFLHPTKNLPDPK
jgi:predicted dehydrogenase